MFVDVEKFPGRPVAPMSGIVPVGPAVAFRVALPAHGKERPRFANGKVYTTDANKNYENSVRACMRAAMGARPQYERNVAFLTAIHIEVPPPYEWPEERRADALAGRTLPPILTPDLDNAAKSVMDALNGGKYGRGLYRDDKQVVFLSVSRGWAMEHAVTATFVPVQRATVNAVELLETLVAGKMLVSSGTAENTNSEGDE